MSTPQAKPGVAIPEDPRLPQLAWALDWRRMKSLLDLPGFAASDGCRVAYIRYKPGTNCIILYEFPQPSGPPVWVYAKLFAEDRVSRPSDQTLLSAYYPEHRMALVSFPHDLQMPSLHLVMTPDQRGKVLKSVISERRRAGFEPYWGTWAPIRYKPERRCVMRGTYADCSNSTKGDPPGKFYARFYAGPEGERTAQWHRHFAHLTRGKVRIPACLGYSAKYRVLLLKETGGKPLPIFFTRSTTKLANALDATSQALATWHGLTPPPGAPPLPSPAKQLLAAASTIQSLLHDPPVPPSDLARRLIETAPSWASEPSLVHGDFYHDQVLIRKGATARFLDLDELAVGDPLYDVANFCAHLRMLVIRGEMESLRAQWIGARFVEGYQAATGRTIPQHHLNWHISASLLRLAPWPFRRFDPNWPQQIRLLLEEAYKTGSEAGC